MPSELRAAMLEDIPALRALIDASVRELSRGYYSDPQVESALRYVFGPDTQLITDRTYFVLPAAEEQCSSSIRPNPRRANAGCT